ncbi:DUF4010 domain-containing protein [bacterium]|nr:DUF4010 domain-containing protein [bacterium]
MSNYILDAQSILLRLILGLFIGILIGIDRDDSWQQRATLTRSRFTFIKPGKPTVGLGGVRTYVILALFGTVLGLLYLSDPRMLPLIIIGFLGVVIYISIAYFLNYFDRHTLGLTTELGMLLLLALTYALGANLLDYKIILGVAVAASLISNLKVEFRKLIGSFTQKEILESIEFVALSVIILPWLPNVTVTLHQVLSVVSLDAGRFNNLVLINPFQAWLVVVFVSGLNFVGYFLAKTLRSSSSILVTAFLGGLVSSTSVTNFLAEKSLSSKSSGSSKLLVSAVLLANMTSFIRIPLIAFALNFSLFKAIAPTLIIMTIASIIIAYSLKRSAIIKESPLTIFTSPLALKPALTFGILFLLVSISSNLGIMLFGSNGFAATAILASLSGLDAVTIVTARAVPNTVAPLVGESILIAAVIVNLLLKIGVIQIYAERRFKGHASFWLGVIALIGIILLGIQYLI